MRALSAGGLPVIEVMFRNEAARDCLRAIAAGVPAPMMASGGAPALGAFAGPRPHIA